MKRCTYCGRENEDQASSCVGCGSPLEQALQAPPPIPSVTPPPIPSVPPPPRPRTLGAGIATLILVIYIGAQFFGGIFGAFAAGLIYTTTGQSNLENPQQAADFEQAIFAPVILFALVAGGFAMVLASSLLVRDQLRDNSPAGAAWVAGSAKHRAQAFALGILIAAVFCAVAIPFQEEDAPMGPLTKMAFTPGIPQLLWLLAALAIAPPIEELLFRGVFYGGYRKSFGPITAAIVTTLLFTLLHITEIMYSIIAAVSVISIAAVALWLRLRSAAVGPAIAAHFGYNTVVGLVTVLHVLAD